MDTQNEGKRELSERFDSSTSPPGISTNSPDRDHGETKLAHKVDRILAACEDPHDLDHLIRLATSTDGLINDDVRKVACKSLAKMKRPDFLTLTATQGPLLLGYGSEESGFTGFARSWRDLPRHEDEDQVGLDVNRSFIYYPKSRRVKSLQDRLILT